MSDEMERGEIERANQASDHIRNPATARYNHSVVSSRSLLVEMPAQPPVHKPVATVHQPGRPWDFLKRLSRSDHSGWLITTFISILVITMTLSFGFAKGWFDTKITLSASVVFFVLLAIAMLIAHWPFRNR